MLFAQTMVGSQEERLHIGDQSVHPAQSAAVLIEDPEMVVIPLAQRSPKRPEGIAVDLAAGTNCLLDNGTHRLGIQLGNLYFEEAGMPRLGEGHRGQRAGFLRSTAPLPI